MTSSQTKKRAMWLAIVAGAFMIVAPVTGAQDDMGVRGAWDLTLETPGGERPSWVNLFEEESIPAAEFVGTGGGKNRATDVKVEGDSFQWTMGKSVYQAVLADGTLTGHKIDGKARTPFTGERVLRPVDVSGVWDCLVRGDTRVRERVLTLNQNRGNITGHYKTGAMPELALSDGKLSDDRLTYSLELENNSGQQFVIRVDFKVQGDRLFGIAAIAGNDREIEVTATRRRQWGEPIALFGGGDLSNWDFQKVGSENQWKVVDGVMVNEARGWNIFTKQKFKDYRLQVDVKIPPKGNSGIYLNGRYEVQVADTFGREVSAGGMGAIYGRAVPTANPSKPADEWQTFDITFVDYWATVVLNGTTIVDNVLIEGITGGALDSHESEPGSIMLQGDHGHIEYRNIILTPLAR